MQEPVTRLSVLAVLIGFLAAANFRGIKSGAAASNMFTVAKLVPLILFAIAGGVFLLRAHPAIPGVLQSGASVPIRNWLEAVLVLMFAYGGFEGAVIPMAETKDPRRDAPFALLVALVTVTLLFFAIQYIVVAVLPGASMTDRPLAAAARQFLGTAGAALISTGALISVCGFLTAQLLLAPRLTFALGEKGDFPPFFARIHSRFQTPHISILVFAAIIWCLAAAGNFTWNVFLSSVGRLFIYGFTCAALPVLRTKVSRQARLSPPGGKSICRARSFFHGLAGVPHEPRRGNLSPGYDGHRIRKLAMGAKSAKGSARSQTRERRGNGMIRGEIVSCSLLAPRRS